MEMIPQGQIKANYWEFSLEWFAIYLENIFKHALRKFLLYKIAVSIMNFSLLSIISHAEQLFYVSMT